MSFADAVKNFAGKAERLTNGAFVSTAVELQKSIKFGSALTGAPPMPVAAPRWEMAGALRDSVKLEFPDPQTALIYTTKWYAPNVEDNTEGHTYTSGAPHGWKLTIASFVRVVAAVVARQQGAR
jgi:hypothetical protein